MSEASPDAPASTPSEPPPPAAMPAREPVPPDPRHELHRLARELVRVKNRRLLVEYLRRR